MEITNHQNIEKEKNKFILVLGAGESGTGAALLAKKKGWKVFVSDSGTIQEKYKNVLLNNDIEFEEGRHSVEKCLSAVKVVKSPGIPENTEILQLIRQAGIPVVSEPEFAFGYTRAEIIGITGSNGKTTTTMLTHHVLTRAGHDVCLAGNVGNSFAAEVARREPEKFILEISSFQLDGMFDFRVNTAVLTNITPDHLDRYDYRFENYIASKFRIINNQTESDVFIYCDDDPVIRKEMEKRNIPSRKLPFSIQHAIKGEGAFLHNREIIINVHKSECIMNIENLAMQGKHNIYNSMAAAVVARIYDVSKETIREALSDFQGVEHRLEYVAVVHGVEFINDSKATNVNSTWYALESMIKPVIWIVGGQDKGNDYSLLKPLVREKVRAIICLGVDNTKIHKAFGKMIDTMIDTRDMREAVRLAYELSKPGDVVLLSPACASFDLFKNYEERGNQFKRAVFDL